MFVRKRNRLKDKSLYQKGFWYFVTVCTVQKVSIFNIVAENLDSPFCTSQLNNSNNSVNTRNGELKFADTVNLLHKHGTIWQKSYFDHIIRGVEDLERIQEYITYNPQNWDRDSLYPERISIM
jgi:hypothetical protein